MSEKILRPGSQTELGYRDLPERPAPNVSVGLPDNFAEIYDKSPAKLVAKKYREDPIYKSQVDELLRRRGQDARG